MYSQNDEEAIILKHLSRLKGGTFLDIGANDGVTFSNTRCLWDLEWGGVLVEPDPVAFRALHLNVGEQPIEVQRRMLLLNNAITVTGGSHSFYKCSDSLLSSLHPTHNQAKFSSYGVNWRYTEVQGLTPGMLLRITGVKPQLVSIDAEGVSVDLFCAFPWEDERLSLCHMIVVEHDGQVEKMLARLGAVKPAYHQLAYNSENIIFWRSWL